MKQFRYFAVIVLIIVLVFGGIVFVQGAQNDSSDTSAAKEDVLTVAASTYVLEHAAEQVGGEHIALVPLKRAGVDAHSFEPTPREVAAMTEADVFLYHGAGLDAWAEQVAEEVRANGGRVVEMVSYFELHSVEDHDEEEAHEHDAEGEEHHDDEEEHEEDEEGHDHDHSLGDPHIWLDPVLYKQEVEIIRDTFVEADEPHVTQYTANADAYIAQLDTLHAEIQSALAQCSLREIIVAHDAFHYFADRYDITIHAIAGLSPESEPSSRHIAELVDVANEHNIRTIFFEAITSPRLSETIAEEVGADTALLHPIEGLTKAEYDAGETYVSLMQQNAEALRTAMNCQ